jgi:uncharacterized membrane protein
VLRSVRVWAIAGLAVLLPVWLTYVTLRWLFDVMDDVLKPLMVTLLGKSYPGAGIVVSLLLILFVGWLASHFIGQRMIRVGDNLLLRVPLVRAVYGVAKQFTDAIFGNNQQAFHKVVWMEFPSPGVFTLGFVVGETGDYTHVWVPTPPNPFGGFLFLLKQDRVKAASLSVDEGLKIVLSGGVLLSRARQAGRVQEELDDFAAALRRQAG